MNFCISGMISEKAIKNCKISGDRQLAIQVRRKNCQVSLERRISVYRDAACEDSACNTVYHKSA